MSRGRHDLTMKVDVVTICRFLYLEGKEKAAPEPLQLVIQSI